jgi:hypothetical protein
MAMNPEPESLLAEEPVRDFPLVGYSTAPDLAERSEEILREEFLAMSPEMSTCIGWWTGSILTGRVRCVPSHSSCCAQASGTARRPALRCSGGSTARSITPGYLLRPFCSLG